MSATVGIIVFPGTNSEEETLRACQAVDVAARLVHWTTDLDVVRTFDAYVLPGGFAYEDRVRAGAIAAHDRVMQVVREGAAVGKPVLGICNGAQVLVESGLVPGIDGRTQPQAAFAKNAPLGKFRLHARPRQARDAAGALGADGELASRRDPSGVGLAR